MNKRGAYSALTKIFPLTPIPSADLLKDLQENSRTFLKLDLAYLTAVGAVITIFKLDVHSIFSLASETSYVLFGLAVILFLDAIVYATILRYRIWQPKIRVTCTVAM